MKKPISPTLTQSTIDQLKAAGVDTQSPVALAMHALKFGHLDPRMMHEIAAAIRAMPRRPDPFLTGFRNALQ